MIRNQSGSGNDNGLAFSVSNKEFMKFFYNNKLLDKCKALGDFIKTFEVDTEEDFHKIVCCITFLDRYFPKTGVDQLDNTFKEFSDCIDNDISKEDLDNVIDQILEDMGKPTFISKYTPILS